ncbi:MAG: response regulator [Bacillaceae bacterium]
MSKELPIIEVLIVEDDTRIAEIHRRFVEKINGYKVIGIATTKQEAIELATILEPTLILLDIYFPDMNGLDFIKFIKGNLQQTHLIMITAAKEGPTISKAISIGVYDYIVKPVLFERFKETLVRFHHFYRELTLLTTKDTSLSQSDVDQLFSTKDVGNYITTISTLPKGIDKLTLDKVKAFVRASNHGLTAETVGIQCGVSRTTARRYLEYLVSIGAIITELSYGMVGRPERIYTKK